MIVKAFDFFDREKAKIENAKIYSQAKQMLKDISKEFEHISGTAAQIKKMSDQAKRIADGANLNDSHGLVEITSKIDIEDDIVSLVEYIRNCMRECEIKTRTLHNAL